MRKSLLVPFLILFLSSLACSDRTALEPEADAVDQPVQVATAPVKEYWAADYLPLNPHLYGTKTYMGDSGMFTSRIVGTETIPYSTGAITGVKMTFGDGYFVIYGDKRRLWTLKDTDKVLSTTCHELTAYPQSAIWEKFHNGMIWDMTGGDIIWEVYDDDPDHCEQVNTGEGDSHVWFIQIQDVRMPGKTYHNAVIMWELEENCPYSFSPIDFEGLDEVMGIQLPTAAEVNNWAVDDVIMLGHRVGIFFIGNISLDNGILDGFDYLVSTSHTPPWAGHGPPLPAEKAN